jgi:5-methylcytosine-specific restriction enzyme A
LTRSLARACLGCGKQVRGKPRCNDCKRVLDRVKAAKRPDMRTHAETERRRRLVADHRATVGDWCPGIEDHPAHPSADLVADHVVEVAVSGLETGPLRVLCRSENGRRSARVLSRLLPLDPSPGEHAITLPTSGDGGPVVA